MPSPLDSLLLGRRTLRVLVALAFAYGLFCYVKWLAAPSISPFGDFYGLWSAGRFAATEGAAVYDPIRLQAFQRLIDTRFQDSLYYPYPYPPSFLLVLVPLGMLPLGVAYGLWMATTLALYFWATLGRRWWSWSGAALLAAPTTVLAMIAGQNGFLTAALLVGGLRCLASAPVAGGILLGLLSYKPQFGVLVPIALLAARQWRAIAAAALSVLGCIATSAALFGPPIWRSWVESLPLYGKLLADNRPTFLHAMPTIAASIEQTIGSVALADTVQAAATLVVAVTIWRCFARSIEDAIVPLLLCTLLATPYGFIYDAPIIASAILLEWHWRRKKGLPFKSWELALAAAFFESVMIMSAGNLPFAAPLLLIALVAAFLRTRAAT